MAAFGRQKMAAPTERESGVDWDLKRSPNPFWEGSCSALHSGIPTERRSLFLATALPTGISPTAVATYPARCALTVFDLGTVLASLQAIALSNCPYASPARWLGQLLPRSTHDFAPRNSGTLFATAT